MGTGSEGSGGRRVLRSAGVVRVVAFLDLASIVEMGVSLKTKGSWGIADSCFSD